MFITFFFQVIESMPFLLIHLDTMWRITIADSPTQRHAHPCQANGEDATDKARPWTAPIKAARNTHEFGWKESYQDHFIQHKVK